MNLSRTETFDIKALINNFGPRQFGSLKDKHWKEVQY